MKKLFFCLCIFYALNVSATTDYLISIEFIGDEPGIGVSIDYGNLPKNVQPLHNDARYDWIWSNLDYDNYDLSRQHKELGFEVRGNATITLKAESDEYTKSLGFEGGDGLSYTLHLEDDDPFDNNGKGTSIYVIYLKVYVEAIHYSVYLHTYPEDAGICTLYGDTVYEIISSYGWHTFNHGLCARANQGYSFDTWKDQNNNKLGGSCLDRIEVKQDIHITAYFNKECIVSVFSEPSEGTVILDGMDARFNAKEVTSGTEVTLQAIPNDCYEFLYWNDGNREKQRVVTVNNDVEFTAYFSYICKTVTANAEKGGEAYVDDTDEVEVLPGTEVTLEAIADDTYEFSHWNDGNRENPRKVTVYKDADYTAYFSSIVRTITFINVPKDGGIIYVNDNQEYSEEFSEGDEVTIEAVPNEGYEFSHWSDGNTENPRDVKIEEDTEFVAYFVEDGSISTLLQQAQNNAYYLRLCRKMLWNNAVYIQMGDGTIINILGIKHNYSLPESK